MNRPTPYFERAGPPPKRGRLLLVSYHFPPGGTAGALRWQKFTPYLAECGWGVDVITEIGAPDNRDETRLAELPPGTRVFGIIHRDPLTFRVAVTLRGLLKGAVRRLRPPLPPTPTRQASSPRRPVSLHRDEILGPWRKGELASAFRAFMKRHRWQAWGIQAKRLAAQIFTPGDHRVIISCGPPHEVHPAIRGLATKREVPFVLDLRDPWSLVQRLPAHHANRLGLWLSARDEARAMRDARLIVMNTEPAAEAMMERYPDARDRIISVMNGCDADAPPRLPAGTVFSIRYAGSVYLDRDPRPLFKATHQVITRLALMPGDLTIEFMTYRTIESQNLERVAHEEGLGEFMLMHPPDTRAAALDFLAGASVLVNLPQDSSMAIPSKVFDYVQLPAWLLVLEARGSATERLFRDTGADVVDPGDVGGIADVLERRYGEWQSGGCAQALSRDPRFHRSTQAKRLVDAIGAMV